MEEAIFLTRYVNHVTVIHRRDTLRASKIMQVRAFKNPKISFFWDTEVTEVICDGAVTGLRLHNLKTGEEILRKPFLPRAGRWTSSSGIR
jgi:thioredoxin reductase (NADPH)